MDDPLDRVVDLRPPASPRLELGIAHDLLRVDAGQVVRRGRQVGHVATEVPVQAHGRRRLVVRERLDEWNRAIEVGIQERLDDRGLRGEVVEERRLADPTAAAISRVVVPW